MRKTRRKHVPNCLRKYRMMRGLTQREVALIFGMKCPGKISRWEKGSIMPSTVSVIKLAILYRTMSEALFIDQYRQFKVKLHKNEGRILSKTDGK